MISFLSYTRHIMVCMKLWSANIGTELLSIVFFQFYDSLDLFVIFTTLTWCSLLIQNFAYFIRGSHSSRIGEACIWLDLSVIPKYFRITYLMNIYIWCVSMILFVFVCLHFFKHLPYVFEKRNSFELIKTFQYCNIGFIRVLVLLSSPV